MVNQVDITKMRIRKGGNVKGRTLRTLKRDSDKEADNMQLLWACQHDFDQLQPRRQEHLRFMRYLNGEQWSDMVEDPDNPGTYITEGQLVSRTGVTPITQNILQQYMRSVLGQMLTNKYKTVINARREEDAEAAEMLTNSIQACLEANENDTVDINVICALHTMGVAVGKIRYTAWYERNCTDGRIDFVNEQRISWNQDCEDPRLLDLRRISEIHSYTMTELISNFALSKSAEREIRDLYHDWGNDREGVREQNNQTAQQNLMSLSIFGNTEMLNKYRVVEVWTKKGRWVLWANDRATADRPVEYTSNIDRWIEEIEAENVRRIAQGAGAGIAEEDVPIIEYEKHYETYWYCQFLTPYGVSLMEYESPYDHQSHPYVFASMPIIDGVQKPLFSDLVDMQRNINRQRTILDMLVAGSAKNTLFIPEDQLEGHSIEEYADEMMKINGVIKFKPKVGVNALPQFLQRNAINIGVFEVLDFDLKQMQAIGGLSGAIQGQTAKASTPASLYAQQAQNSMLNFVLLFDRFNNYCKKRDTKLLSVLIQYYTVPRYLETAGGSYGQAALEYIPEKARKIAGNYVLVPSQGMDTPVFRQVVNDYLMDMVKAGMIPVESFLQHTSLPFGKQLLQDLQALKQQQQDGQINQGAVEQLQQKVAQQADPRAEAMIKQMMGKNFREDRLPVTNPEQEVVS